MKFIHSKAFACVCAIIIFFAKPCPAQPAPEGVGMSEKNILLISSYNIQIEWGKSIVDGFNSIFPADKYVINHIELGVMNDAELRPTSHGLAWIVERVQNTQPEAIVVFDEPAIELVSRNYALFPENVPIILVGHIGSNPLGVEDKKNVQFINMPIDFDNNLNLGLRLFPKAKKIALLFDGGLEGVEAAKLLKERAAAIQNAQRDVPANFDRLAHLEFIFMDGASTSTDEMLAKLEEISKQESFVMFYSWGSVKDKEHLTQKNYVKAISRIMRENILTFYDDTPENIIGGYMLNGTEYGRFIGEKTKDVVDFNEDIDENDVMRIADPRINWLVFSQKGFDRSVLPQGAIFYNIPASAWETLDFRYVAAVVALIAFLSIALLIISRKALIVSKRNSELFKNLPINIYVFFQNGDICYAYSRDLMVNRMKSISEFGEEFYADYQRNIEKIRRGNRVSVEYSFRSQRRRAIISKLPQDVFWKDTYIAITIDITDLENARRESQDLALRMQTTLNSIADAVIATDKDETVTFMNPVAQNLTGVLSKEAIGKNLDDVFRLYSGENNARLSSPFKRDIERNSVGGGEDTYLVGKSGERHNVSDNAAPIINEEGDFIGSILTFRDVTHERRQQREMAVKNRFLETATGIAHICCFKCDRNFLATEGFDSSILGFKPGEKLPKVSDYFVREDYGNFWEAWQKFINGETDELEIVCASDYFGERKYFAIHSTSEGGSGKNAELFYVVMQDVTKARRDEFLIRDTNKMLSSLIDNIPCSIFVKNLSDGGRYVLHNKQFLEEVEFSGESALNLRDADIFPDAVAEDNIAQDMEVVKSGKPYDAIKSAPTNTGKIIKSHVIKNAITMENGDVYIIGASFDMSNFFESQERIKAYADRQKIINDCLSVALTAPNAQTALNTILELLGRNLSADRAFVFKYDGDVRSLQHVDTWRADHLPEGNAARVIPFEKASQFIREFGKHEILSTCDLQNDDSPALEIPKSFLTDDGVTSFIVTGIFREGEPCGFMGVDYLGRRENGFSKADEHLLRSVAKIIELIFEKERSAEEVREAEVQRRRIIDSIHVPIMLFDTKGNLQALNNAAVKSMPKGMEQLLKEPCHANFCLGKYQGELCPVRRAVLEKRTVTQEMNLFGRDVIATGTPIFDDDGNVINVIESDTDVTDMLETNRKLTAAMRAAQESEKSKSYFLATMSHELRTPLNAVIGYSELTQNPNLNQDERMHNLKNIHFAANTLLNLINDILDLSKLEAGQLEIYKSPINMKAVAEEFENVFKFAAQRKGLYIKMHVAEGIPTLAIDILRLKQIFMNVMGNAIKFTHKGGIDVEIGFDGLSDKSGTLRITIRDTGIGIAPEFIKKIFNPFEQESTDRVRGRGGYEGTGLGLPIVKRLVEKMGGDIEIESEVGSGSAFKLVLRNVEISLQTAAEMEKPKEASAQTVENARFDMTVLIVDDIQLNINVLKNMLKNMGVKVLDSITPEGVLEMLKTENPDLIMTDLWMPKMSGEDLAREIKKNPARSHIPIVAVTADTQMQDPDKLFADVLLKPITKKSVFTMVDKYYSVKKEN